MKWNTTTPRLVLLLLLLESLNLLHFYVSANGKTSGVCVSPGGRFPPFLSEGKPQGRKLASTGEATQECFQLWELLECSICDPRVGVQPGPPVICASFCDRVYHACSDAYFSMDAKTQVLAPCGLNDLVCGRASEWISNGTELCRAAGFSVMSSDDPEEPLCFGGKATFDYIADPWKASQSRVPQKTKGLGVLEDFKQLLESIPFIERVSWAVGGMVLTAGLIFASRRKSHSQRQKQAALQRTARKLGTKMNSGSPVGQPNRRGNVR